MGAIMRVTALRIVLPGLRIGTTSLSTAVAPGRHGVASAIVCTQPKAMLARARRWRADGPGARADASCLDSPGSAWDDPACQGLVAVSTKSYPPRGDDLARIPDDLKRLLLEHA